MPQQHPRFSPRSVTFGPMGHQFRIVELRKDVSARHVAPHQRCKVIVLVFDCHDSEAL